MLTDADLVIRARLGDKAAFGQLIEQYRPLATRVAQRMVAPSTIADELTQEALLQAYLSLDSLRDDTRFGSWLYGITLNVCRDYLRSQKIAYQSLDEAVGGRWFDLNPLAALEPGPEEIVETQALHDRVLHAVQALSPANRDAVLLFYYQDLSLREAAIVLGISTTALKGRLHRARQRLRHDLLPVYQQEQGEGTVIPVNFANIIRVQSNIINDDGPQQWHILLLLDEAGQRVLPIWIGRGEAEALVGAMLWNAPQPKGKRPVTWNFVTSILDVSEVTLEHVTISALRDDVFYATARIQRGETVHEIDARPSDAIPLALLLQKPLYVSADEVAPETWWPVPDGLDITASLLGVGTAGLEPGHFDGDPVNLGDTALTQAEWDDLDDDTKAQYRQAHQQAVQKHVFSA